MVVCRMIPHHERHPAYSAVIVDVERDQFQQAIVNIFFIKTPQFLLPSNPSNHHPASHTPPPSPDPPHPHPPKHLHGQYPQLPHPLSPPFHNLNQHVSKPPIGRRPIPARERTEMYRSSWMFLGRRTSLPQEFRWERLAGCKGRVYWWRYE